MFSWSMALAIPGAIAAPKRAAPAAEKKAFRDCSASAFKTKFELGPDVAGANAEAAPRVARSAKPDNFILSSSVLVMVTAIRKES